MSVILIVGVPGSGKTTLANNLKAHLESIGKDSVIVTEPQVERGTFDSSDAERLGRSDFKNAFQRELGSRKIVIADSMNFIKGFRYELFCLAREANLGWCVAFCDVDDSVAMERSKCRYTDEERLRRMIGRMEKPSERVKFDKPLFIVKDPNDEEMIKKILEQTLSRTSVLTAKKATNSCAETAHMNDRIDMIINNFCDELLKVQASMPIGSSLNIMGATFVLKKIYNNGQLKRAKREFATRAKMLSDETEITQVFADSLSLIH